MTQNLLITGRPGAGKTTLIRRIAESFGDRRLVGFYTQEILSEGTRVGFELVSLDGRRRVLARTGMQSTCTVGRYGVDVEGFEAFLASVPFSDPEVDLIVIDEIGKMEWCSERFRRVVREALDSPTPCIATIAMKAGGGIAAIRDRNDVALVEITRQNRNTMLPRLLAEVREMMSRATGA
ncbi:AAA family ATPase [Methanoculleus sp. FWC-SCC1]|uniref:Nucleoside-triphosphatase FGU65_09010 n=1 Tax=Methanoculleus frigidifontis TaxID=2584085 RepID=A0ABT8MAQ6_9EURY|nr:nucleoside-triphosphatase [Methanoculleus sp. FWC-SCC1]MDN7025024.1 AAA family ATPase [Methanoculleus sp. FWC-SCC1]